MLCCLSKKQTKQALVVVELNESRQFALSSRQQDANQNEAQDAAAQVTVRRARLVSVQRGWDRESGDSIVIYMINLHQLKLIIKYTQPGLRCVT